MTVSVTWNIRPEEVWPRIVQAQVDAIEADIVALVNNLLDPAQEWMRENARWTDRTGNARAGLYTDLSHVARQTVHLLLSHGPTVEYAYWLEWAHQSRFGILGDTVDNWQPVLFRGVQEIVRRHSS